ncbi:hypothetical protein [Methylobacterium soli]|uniref:Uncharacterized protein n=1 Tax=Methylobacterium soli TaxID=553447 RepID=A0A6L3SX94_9HYPH|nr:hypothetical protein [Methylobacterium soli]KAB1078536.1 hypothetical protein F6X53_14140 [Methylobacterium soli]GJE41584.1 hypothetical protein AEGHOMDF_0750 [Methylobacterium soli]
MARRFTIIAGGLSNAQTRADARPRDWRVDLTPVEGVTPETIAAWRALLTRSGAQEPHFADPDYILPAARHQAAGRDLVFALVWGAQAHGAETLHAVVPLALPHPIWGARRAALWRPPGLAGPMTHLIEGRYASEVEAALRANLASARRRLTLSDLPGGPAKNIGRPSLQLLPGRHAPPVRTIPAHNFVGIRAKTDRPAMEIERISEPVRIRDAVEAFLVLDARASRKPIVADPAEAAMVRVVTRLFARRRQVSVDLARHRGEIVSGALQLGAGDGSVIWRQAALASAG